MVAKQVRRSVVISNLQIGLLPMDSDRTPLGKGKDVLHGAARAVPLRQSVEQPWARPLSYGPDFAQSKEWTAWQPHNSENVSMCSRPCKGQRSFWAGKHPKRVAFGAAAQRQLCLRPCGATAGRHP